MKTDTQSVNHEKKERIPAWLYPSTIETLDQAYPRANCKSRSEFIENAVRFYAGYVSGEDAIAFLPPALVSAIRGTLDDSENHIARLLFKLAVEMDVMMNVLAAAIEISPERLDDLRGKCINEVRKTSGGISFKDTAARHAARRERPPL